MPTDLLDRTSHQEAPSRPADDEPAGPPATSPDGDAGDSARPVGRLVVVALDPGDAIGRCAHLLRRAGSRGVPVVLVWVTDGPDAHPAEVFPRGSGPAVRRRGAVRRALETLGVEPVEQVRLQLDRSRVVDGSAAALERALSLVLRPEDVVVTPDHCEGTPAATCASAVRSVVDGGAVVTRAVHPRPRSVVVALQADESTRLRQRDALGILDAAGVRPVVTDVEEYDVDPLDLLTRAAA